LTKFETGYKGIFRTSDNDFVSDTLNYILNTYVRNNDVTNHFKMTDYINAVYGTFSHKIKKFRFKLGLRLEHTLTDGELVTDGTKFSKNYLDVFPTASISQKFGMAHELQLSYSRRITRPMIYRLNPFVRKSNLKFIYIGNPELEPEYSDSYELSYIFISNPINITPVGFYRRTTNVISNYSYIVDTNVTVTTYRNAGSGYSYGMDFIVSSRALKWWNINSTFSFYKIKYDAGLVNDYSGEEGFSWKANIRSFFTIGDIFNIEVYYNYSGKRIIASGFNQPRGSLDISINKTFLKKKLTIGIRGEDLFKTNKWGSETNGVGVKSVYNYNWDSRGVYLNLNYNFGNSEDYYRKSKNTKQNENEKSDSNEQGSK
jgi:outer membrane receptor protein involved in Fe transport